MSAETRGRAMIRIPRDLLDQLGELARLNDRSASAELRIAVRAHLAASPIGTTTPPYPEQLRPGHSVKA